jgi:hypothetical protein
LLTLSFVATIAHHLEVALSVTPGAAPISIGFENSRRCYASTMRNEAGAASVFSLDQTLASSRPSIRAAHANRA